MIGSVTDSCDLNDSPPGCVVNMFGWDALTQSYVQINPLATETTLGYWILIFDVPCEVTIGCNSGVAAKTGAAVQSDLVAFYQLYGMQPPPPPASVDSEPYSEISVPTEFGLSQNYPNPFNPSTKINYQLPMSSRVTVTIYDVLGREIRTLVAGVRPAGTHRVLWDGRDAGGQQVESGVYFVRMRAGKITKTRRVILLR